MQAVWSTSGKRPRVRVCDKADHRAAERWPCPLLEAGAASLAGDACLKALPASRSVWCACSNGSGKGAM